jgi:hypothetical protein
MTLISFPDIPDVAGVPVNLPRIPGDISVSSVARISLGAVQGVLWSAFQIGTQWGIWDEEGKPLGSPADYNSIQNSLLSTLGTFGAKAVISTGSIEYTKESSVCDAPIEKGSFVSYNKVDSPGLANVSISYAGSETERRAYLIEIDKATKSTKLYSVVTPEITYINNSIEKYSYRRTASNGTTLLIIDFNLKEIREVLASYTQSSNELGNIEIQVIDSKNPEADKASSSGNVQATEPRDSVGKQLLNKVASIFE